MLRTADVIVIGAGIAGSSLAAELAAAGASVIVVERESQPGYHTTGRSAAVYIESYGPEQVRRLTRASRSWLAAGPDGTPFVKPCGLLWLARPGEDALVDSHLAGAVSTGSRLERISPDEAVSRVPVLRLEQLAAAIYEADALAMDVAAIHQSFLRQLIRHGGELVLSAEITALSRSGKHWRLLTKTGDRLEAPIVVNAAGAWADQIAVLAGVTPIGLVPKRRTIVTVDLPDDMNAAGWPVTGDLAGTFYFKPEAGRLLVSPADETPVAPQDVQPEELDIAVALDRLEQATTLSISRPGRSWAGLRTFAPDGELVIGFDTHTEGFFWLAGQGGYGIQTCPAAARLAAALVDGQPTPANIAEFGVLASALSPSRMCEVI